MARKAQESSAVQYFLGTISRHSPENWELCKRVNAWGVTQSRSRAASTVNRGDVLIVWLGGRGYIAAVEIVAAPTAPKSSRDVPWEGGDLRWAYLLPFKVLVERPEPLWIPFAGDRQKRTGLSKSAFRSSLKRLSGQEGARLLRVLNE